MDFEHVGGRGAHRARDEEAGLPVDAREFAYDAYRAVEAFPPGNAPLFS